MTNEDAISAPETAIAEQRAVMVYDRIAAHKITNVESYLLMADLLKEVKRIVNKFEDETAPEIKQAHDLHKALIARKKKWADKFDEAEKLAKEKLRHFAATTEVPKVEGISINETWTGCVVDEDAIPRHYMTPDLEKLKGITRVLKEATDIPGWQVSKLSTIAVRE